MISYVSIQQGPNHEQPECKSIFLRPSHVPPRDPLADRLWPFPRDSMDRHLIPDRNDHRNAFYNHRGGSRDRHLPPRSSGMARREAGLGKEERGRSFCEGDGMGWDWLFLTPASGVWKAGRRLFIVFSSPVCLLLFLS